MTDRERFEALMNTLVLMLQLSQQGVLTNSEATKEIKHLIAEIKKQLNINDPLI